MYKFKPGDKVRVVSKRPESEPPLVTFKFIMRKHLGGILTISNFCSGGIIYFVEENPWSWHEKWLEPIK